MSQASLQVNLTELKLLIARLEDRRIQEMLLQLPQRKGAVALVIQAIRDNFDKEGPGWEPLKASTIIRSATKANQKKIRRGTLKPEELGRKILRRKGLLMKSVTSAQADNNIFQTQGTKLIWGTHLKYASIHQHGGVIRRGNKTTRIPARPYLRLNDQAMHELEKYVLEQTLDILDRYLVGRAAA
jgi:phage gpG-like protein